MISKFKFLTLVLSFILVFSLSVSAVELQDVPRDHWAYDSVKLLIERGYLSLYEDGNFSGKTKVSRYEMAEVVARLLDNMESGGQQLSNEDVDVIRELSLEFRDELVAVAQSQQVFEERLNKIEQQNMIQNEDLATVNNRVNNIEQEVSNIIDNIVQLKELQQEIDILNNKVASLESNLATTRAQLQNQNQNLATNKTIQELEDGQSVALTRINTLENKIKDLEAKLATENEQLANNKPKEDNSMVILGALAALLLLL